MMSNNYKLTQESGKVAPSESNLVEKAIETLSVLQVNPKSPPRQRRTKAKRDGHKFQATKIFDTVSMDNTFVFGNAPEKGDCIPPNSDEERCPRVHRSILSCHCKMCAGDFPAAPEHATWKDVVHCTFRVMTLYYGKQFFSMKTEIVAFFEGHWEKIWESKERQENWCATLCMIMSKYTQIFKSGSQEMGASGYWGLGSFDMERIENDLKNFKYPQPQNKKRGRQVETVPAPKKQRIVDDGTMLYALASVAFECFTIEKTSPLAFVPLNDNVANVEEQAFKLKEQIKQLGVLVSNLDQDIRKETEQAEMLDSIERSMNSVDAKLCKDMEVVREDAAKFNLHFSSMMNNRVVPEGMVPNFIPLSI